MPDTLGGLKLAALHQLLDFSVVTDELFREEKICVREALCDVAVMEEFSQICLL